MGMQQIETSYNTNTSSNQGFNQGSALQIRLETSQIIENVEMFLRGAIIIVEQDEKGRISTKRVDRGLKKANDLGIQTILNYLQLILNPQVVQGNFPVDSPGHSTAYEDYIYDKRVDLTEMLVLNCYNWEIMDEDIDGIIDSVMSIITPFMTRLIDNKERESYETTIKHSESNTLREGEKGTKLFG